MLMGGLRMSRGRGRGDRYRNRRRVDPVDRDEAIRLLKDKDGGIEEWNRRRAAGEEISDLQFIDLSNTTLDGVNLSELNLRGANLNYAALRNANLFKSNLRGAKLRLAHLLGAYLSGANLAEVDFDSADLHHAVLDGADLGKAKLHNVDLRDAKLTKVDFSGADLSEANLGRAILEGADLTETDLTRADLRFANFSKTKLTGARLLRATCRGTIFVGVDLSSANGLDSIDHEGPCVIDTDTLFLSRGRIPAVFLRGCGVPDALIEYLPYVFNAMQPIQFYSCFISYSSKNEEFAKRLHSRLRDNGLRVWFAREDIQGGKKIHEQIDEAIRIHDKLLLVLSPDSMNSEWVKTEIRKARKAELKENKRKLFPIRLIDFNTLRDWECFDADSGKDLGVEIREYFIPDFTNWKDHDSFEESFTRLLNDLKDEKSTGTKPA
jgi:uncharacterized protein YjbI with pentapeptide repeats